MEKQLTDRDREILAFIHTRQRRAGPTLREVAKQFGVFPHAIQRTVARLRAAGEIEDSSGKHAGLVVHEKENAQ